MAKMKDDHFELVVNIQKFTPEEVKVYVESQSVIVQAKKCTQEGFVTDTYENKFNLPEDVDVSRLTSGLSRDGILMIRVPRRVSPERIIPIQFDTKISAVKKAIQQTVQHVETEMTAEEVQQDLLKENITPLTIEKEEDAVQAASAEVIEAMTIGVAEEAGAEVNYLLFIMIYAYLFTSVSKIHTSIAKTQTILNLCGVFLTAS